MSDSFVGRQPIYDRDLQLFAYELLFRSGRDNRATVSNGDQATSQVMINAFLDFGLDLLVGNAYAFINLTRGFLVGDRPLPFPPERVVLEVLEDIEPDSRVVEAVRSLVAKGYTIALDDFVYRPEYRPLIELTHIIKIDLMALAPERWAEQVSLIRNDNPQVKLLAEKVETQEEFERCQALGFDYFQGYFLCRPTLVAGSGAQPSNRLVLVNLLAKLRDPQASFDDIESLIVRDPPLTYRLLRYINSAAVGLRQPVESVHRALMLIGVETIRSWATLILLARMEDKPLGLIETALVRAKMCEMVAIARKLPGKEQYFTVGLFSLLDALLDRPLPELLNSIPLAEEVRAALLEEQGPLGEVLGEVLDYEAGRWEALLASSLPPQILRVAFMEAVAWAQGSAALLSGD